ncbi:hypothetical protein DFQ26_004187 [Actinomortierella ambigua]|nr:hypothetical protein DFQ26_004187 [Actinomortierella ambigua]
MTTRTRMVGRPKRVAAQAVKSYATDSVDLGDGDSPPTTGGDKGKSPAKGKTSKAKASKNEHKDSGDSSDSDVYQAQDDEDDEGEDEVIGDEEVEEEDQEAVEEPEDDLIDDGDNDAGKRKRAGKKRAGAIVAKPQQRGMFRVTDEYPTQWMKSYLGPSENDIGYYGNEEVILATSVFPNVLPSPSDFEVYK